VRRALIVVALLVVVAGAFAAGALIFANRDIDAWTEADEKGFLDDIIEPQHTEVVDFGSFQGTRVVPGNEEWAACVLEVYEKYFPSYDDYAKSSDDSPTLLKASAASKRQCR
jgi:hypothetical protein